MKILGSRVRRRRHALNMTQEVLAEAIGASQGMIAKMERTEGYDAKTSTLTALACALRCEASYLFGGTSEGVDEHPPAETDGIDAQATRRESPTTFGGFPNWEPALKKAKVLAPHIPHETWESVRTARPFWIGMDPPSPQVLAEVAQLIFKHKPA